MTSVKPAGGIEVTVIIAVKNGTASLQGCLDSVAAQAGVSLETIVIDGASTDGTQQLLEENLRQRKIAGFVSEPDGGIYEAWNKALRRARGAWVCFLGCDDRFHDSGALRDLLDARRDGVRVIYGRVNLVTQSGVLGAVHGRPWLSAREAFLAGTMIPHPGTLHHRTLFQDHGFFDETYRIAGDYEMLLRELRTGEALFVDRAAVEMRFGGMSSNPAAIHSMLCEVRRARARHGLKGTPGSLRTALVASWLGAWIQRLFGSRAYRWAADLYRLARGKPRIWTV